MAGILHSLTRELILKINLLISEVIQPTTVELGVRFLHEENTNFSFQVEYLSLDPRTDFRYADLAGVDFSHSDVRGFDFTGADLRGATGVDVQWDETTILKAAEIDDSLFAHRVRIEQFLNSNPPLAGRAELLARDYWARTILGVEKILRQEIVSRDDVLFAQAVFSLTGDVTVRSNILYFLKPAMTGAEEHKDFIYDIFATKANEPSTIQVALTTLSSFYRDDVGAINLLMRYLKDANKGVRQAAYKGALISKLWRTVADELRDHAIGESDPIFRRLYLQKIASVARSITARVSIMTSLGLVRDFAELVTDDSITKVADRALRADDIPSNVIYAAATKSNMTNEERRWAVISHVSELIRKDLEHMREEFGIPFRFETRRLDTDRHAAISTDTQLDARVE